MDRKWLYWLVQLMTLFTLTKQAVDIAPQPDLTLLVLNVEVQEKEVRAIILNSDSAVLVCADADNDTARAYIQSVSPTSAPCGIHCFQLRPCTLPTDPEFCLHFIPNPGSLDYSIAPTYTLSIVCTDDLELPSTATLTVTVVPNSPPQFDPPVLRESETINAKAKKANDDITTVSAPDPDTNDKVTYTMTISPPTVAPYISIGRSSGIIIFTQDPLLVCEAVVTVSVEATDGNHLPIGPKVIDITLNGNLKPTITNLDTTIQVDENTAAGSIVYTLKYVDAVSKVQQVQMTADVNEALELYELDGLNLRLRVSPDYERSETRSIQLFFQANDGYCFSDVYSLTIEIIDVNEEPEYQPPPGPPKYRVVLFAYEGRIRVDTGLEAYDDDNSETLTHTLISDPSGLFRVDPTSGQIYSVNEVDIDDNTEFKNFDLKIRVTDSGGLTDEENVVIKVLDSNDQPPYFQANTYTFAANLCSKLGDVLGTVTGDDKDSTCNVANELKCNQNDVFFFGGGGGFTSVTSDGQVVLTTPITDGTSSIGTATITDTGLYPGPLSGTPVNYIVTCCAPCPTTPAPPPTGGGGGGTTTAGGGGGGGVTTTAAPVTSAADLSNSSSGFSDALPWVIPAAILGLFWLALMGYLIYRFCCPCKSPCPSRFKPSPVKPKPPPQPQPKIKKPPRPPTPKPAFTIQPLPPPTPEPEPNPYLFGFWKEKYTDQNHVRQPKRQNKPVAIEHLPNEGNPPTPPPELRLGPNNAIGPNFIPTNLNAPEKNGPPPTPPTPAWSSPAKKKSKLCVIL